MILKSVFGLCLANWLSWCFLFCQLIFMMFSFFAHLFSFLFAINRIKRGAQRYYLAQDKRNYYLSVIFDIRVLSFTAQWLKPLWMSHLIVAFYYYYNTAREIYSLWVDIERFKKVKIPMLHVHAYNSGTRLGAYGPNNSTPYFVLWDCLSGSKLN